MSYVSVSCQFYTLALLSRFDFSFPPSISNRAGWKCKNTGRAGFTMLASWIRMLYMWRVYANILIRPRIIYSCSWKGSTIAHSFCFRTTLSESFDFFYSLKLANKCIYLTFLLSICMYQQFPLDPTCDRNRSVPSYCVGLLEEATSKISKSHRHHAQSMVSVPQNEIRSHVNTDWTWIQP